LLRPFGGPRSAGRVRKILKTAFLTPSGPFLVALDGSQHALDASQQALDGSQQALDASQHALDASQHALDASQHALDGSQHALDGSQHALDGYQQALDASQPALDASQHALDGAQQALDGVQRPDLAKILPITLLKSSGTCFFATNTGICPRTLGRNSGSGNDTFDGPGIFKRRDHDSLQHFFN